MKTLIGRKRESLILSNALKSNRPELIAVYGRRRVGKTFLVRNVYKNEIQFELSGIHNGTLKEQLCNFYLTLTAKNCGFKKPANQVFFQLSTTFGTPMHQKGRIW